MFQNSNISDDLSIYNFFKQLKFDLYLTKPQLNYLESIMNSIISKGYKGKISNVHQLLGKSIEQILLGFYQLVIGMRHF